MQPSNCCSPCSSSPEIINVPGVQGTAGAAGADGTDGVNAFTTTTANITLPAAAGPVTVPAIPSFASTAWMAIGQKIFISDGTNFGTFQVLSIPSATGATLQWLDYDGDSAGTTVINSGAKVSPSGTQPALSAALPTVITDNTTGTASNTLTAAVGIYTLTFHINLVALTAAAADLVTNYVLGYAFKILSVDFMVTTLGTGAGATMNLNLEIGAVNVTGGVVNPTLANTATLGSLVAGSAVTGTNIGTGSDSLSIEVAAGGTIFTAGQGTLLVKVQNLDTANAAASLADHINDLIASLTP